jgi:cytochrome P450
MNRDEFLLRFRTLSFMDSRAADARGVLELRAKPTRRLLVWRPDTIRWIFQADPRLRHPGSRTLVPLLGRRSLLWAEGDRHAEYRRLLGPELRGRRLDQRRAVVAAAVRSAIDQLRPGSVIGLADWTRSITLRVIGQIVLGKQDDPSLEPFARWIRRELGSRARTLTRRYLHGGSPRNDRAVDRALLRNAEAATRARVPTFATLLAATGQDDGELRDNIVSLLFAGHETTASAAAWTLYRLDRDQELRHDVISELEATTTDGADAHRVPLLQAVVQEALRLNPPAPWAGNRVTTEDDELFGGPLARGTVLTPAIHLAHHNPEFFPSPGAFDPHRFLDGRVPGDRFFPFGGGTRRCLGSELAMLELRMITAAVLRRTGMRCANPGAGVPRLRGPATAPAPSLRMVVTAWRA